jgi:hypothetical protein
VVASLASRLKWVTLVYRVPRTPSTPRIAIWRRLRALGVAQLGDGVVALPEDARTREHLEWVAEQVIEAGGTAMLFRAEALSRDDERAVAHQMASARAEEYRDLTARATAALAVSSTDQSRVLKRLRRDLRTVQRRDYFPPPDRGQAIATINALASALIHAADAGVGADRSLAAESS